MAKEIYLPNRLVGLEGRGKLTARVQGTSKSNLMHLSENGDLVNIWRRGGRRLTLGADARTALRSEDDVTHSLSRPIEKGG